MKTTLYQIFDRIATMPVTPIVGFPRDEAAIRWFQEVAAVKDNPISKYPEDHTLLKLGYQDIESGAIDAHLPTPVYDGKTMLEQLDHMNRIQATRRETPAPAPAGNNNGPADASAGVQIQPTHEEMACRRCGRHWQAHPTGRCENGEPFLPSLELAARYNEYLKEQH